MKLVSAFVAVFLFVGLRPAQGQSPDDKYVQVFSLIEEADKLNASGQARQAVTKYLEAQVALKDLQRMHPDWNAKIVSYRQEYISSKLGPLTQKVPGTGVAAASGSQDGASAAAQSTTNQVKAMQEDIARLAAQNALLEAKLREALTVQPAAADPRELAKAEERIKALQKERDLLAVSLEQTRQKISSSPDAGGQPKDSSADARQNLITQTAVASVLKRQNEELQKQIAELQLKLKGPARGTGNEETLALKETIAALEASNRVMKVEQFAMESRLMQFVRQYGSGSTEKDKDLQNELAAARAAAKAAQEERDQLMKRLNDVTKELNARATQPSTPASQQLEKQLEAIRAKLEIFEAKPVPYTPEELALFKQAPSIKVAAAQTNAVPVKRKPAELPPGAGPLFADAERAIDGGRFEDAEKKLRDILRQDEKNPYILAKLAAVQLDQDKSAEAEGSLKKALESDAQDPVSLYLLGSLKLRQEKFDEALDALSLSAKLYPENAQTQYFLARALIQKGQRGAAETALRKAIQLKPGWGEAHYLLAVIYATQQPSFKELAQYHYKRAIAGGAPRNMELEHWMEKATASAAK